MRLSVQCRNSMKNISIKSVWEISCKNGTIFVFHIWSNRKLTDYYILFVDDEPIIPQAFERQLRKRFSIRTAESAEEALKILQVDGSCAVIVSDMWMPGMDGIKLLAQVKNLYPDTVRIMLTGNADQETAIEEVNCGQIFRFLTKPIRPEELTNSLNLAVREYRLITAEKELFSQTLKGTLGSSVSC